MRPARLPPSASNTPRPTASALRNPRAAVRGGAGAAGDDRRNSMMPLPPSGRRSTLMTNGRLSHSVNRNSATSRLTSVGGGGGGAASASRVKDPRPLNDRAYLQGVARDLVAFIVERGYDGAQMTARTLASASSKEFVSIFTFLLQRLDLSFEFASAGGGGTGGERGGGGGAGAGAGVAAGGGGARRFEDELPILLKMLGYPYTMSRSALSAMGSPHTWPALVGVLHWLMNMVRLKEVYTVDELSQRENDVISRRDAFFLDNTVKAYDAWLSGAEEFEEVDAERTAFFSADSAARAESIEQLTRENTASKERVQLLRGGTGNGGDGAPAQSPLVVARQRFATLNDNITKLDQMLPQLDDHLASVNTHITARQQHVADLKSCIAQLRRKRTVHLEPVLAKQESEAIDADRIVAQREKLRTALQECAAETQRVENEQKAVERRLALKMQQLQTALRKYHEDVEVYDNFQSCLIVDFEDDGDGGDDDDGDGDDGIDGDHGDHDSGEEHANSDNGGHVAGIGNNGSHSESSMTASSSSTATSLLSSTRDQQQQRRRRRKQRGHAGYHDTVLSYPDWKVRLSVTLNPDNSIVNAQQLLLPDGRDVECDVMPHLQTLRSVITRLSPLADATAIRLDEQLDVASERGMMLQHDVAVLRGTKEQKEAQYNEEREAFQKCLAARSRDILKEDDALKVQQVEAEQRVRDEDERIGQLEMTKKEVEGQLRGIWNRVVKVFEQECQFTQQHVANVNQIKEVFFKVTAQRRKKHDNLLESLGFRQQEGQQSSQQQQQQQQGEGSSRQR